MAKVFASLRLLSCILLIAFPSSIFGQSSEIKGLDVVPENLRTRLIERLNSYNEFERTGQYENLYDLLSAKAIADQLKGKSKSDYAKNRRAYDAKSNRKYLGFEPTVITKAENGEPDYLICGWDVLKQKGKKWGEMRCVDAYLESGQWYFSPGFIVHVNM